MALGIAQAAKNESVILEFWVADVDGGYEGLQNLVKVWVKPPALRPWQARLINFREPDGKLGDFFAPAKAQ